MLYRPLWSTAILDELRYHEAQKLVGRGHDPLLAAQRAQLLVDRMSTALVGGADVIVTNNLKDFLPQQIPKPLMVISPAHFAADTVAVSPYVAYRAVMGMASRFVRPSSTVDELGHLVARYAMIEPVELIRSVT